MENSQRTMLLTLGICMFSLQWILTHQQVNVALNGRAAQSSFYKINFNPYSVIDGSKETNLYSYHCSATNAQYNPWWRVDLLGIYNISNVIITGRSDCCTQEIIGAVICIGSSIVNNGNNNPRCGVISSITSDAPVNYTCNMLGRYVNVVIPNLYRHLVLCEVEVFGVLVAPVTRRAFLKLRFKSSEDLQNPTVRDEVLQQMKSTYVHLPIFQLRWTKETELETRN